MPEIWEPVEYTDQEKLIIVKYGFGFVDSDGYVIFHTSEDSDKFEKLRSNGFKDLEKLNDKS